MALLSALKPQESRCRRGTRDQLTITVSLSGCLLVGRLHCKCPLLGVKRTWAGALQMSAYDPKRTYLVDTPLTAPHRVPVRLIVLRPDQNALPTGAIRGMARCDPVRRSLFVDQSGHSEPLTPHGRQPPQ